MKVLKLCAYFYPETTAGSHLANDLFEAFSRNGIYCTCYTPEPTRSISNEIRKLYKSKKKEYLYNNYIFVERFKMFRERKNPLQRAIRYIFCSIIQYLKGIRTKNVDVVFSGSTPPINGIVSALVARKLTKKYGYKVPFVYELQDIFPDSLVNSHLTKKGSLMWKIGRIVENYTYKSADKIIVPSKIMKQNIINKGVEADKIEVISNWIDINKVFPIPKDKNFLYEKFSLSRKDFIVVYAGNFGEAQGAEILFEVANQLKEYKDLKLVIFGGGANFKDAQKKSEQFNNVFLSELLSLEYISQVYSLGEVGIITCKKGTGKAGMPSKTWSIMACNTPIIASFDTDSELSDLLKEANAGECVEAENIEELVKKITDYYFAFKNNELFKINSREYIKKYVSKEVCVEKYLTVIKLVMNSSK